MLRTTRILCLIKSRFSPPPALPGADSTEIQPAQAIPGTEVPPSLPCPPSSVFQDHSSRTGRAAPRGAHLARCLFPPLTSCRMLQVLNPKLEFCCSPSHGNSPPSWVKTALPNSTRIRGLVQNKGLERHKRRGSGVYFLSLVCPSNIQQAMLP